MHFIKEFQCSVCQVSDDAPGSAAPVIQGVDRAPAWHVHAGRSRWKLMCISISFAVHAPESARRTGGGHSFWKQQQASMLSSLLRIISCLSRCLQHARCLHSWKSWRDVVQSTCLRKLSDKGIDPQIRSSWFRPSLLCSRTWSPSACLSGAMV